MRVVLDTNIIVSAFHFRGSVREVIHTLRARGDTWVVSPFIFEEVDRVLASKFRWSPARRQALFTWISGRSHLVEPEIVPDIITADPSDNNILAATQAGLAHIIVSGDTKHLLPLKQWSGIRIITAHDFLELPEATRSEKPPRRGPDNTL